MDRTTGLVIVAIGLVVVVVGLLVMSGALSWFGRLPGDVRVGGERGRLYVPIVSSIIASVVLTVVVNLVIRWFR